jgi:hypothetical protein
VSELLRASQAITLGLVLGILLAVSARRRARR